MASTKINVGRIVNDGLGDDIRTAFLKINDNFDGIDDQLGITLTYDAANIGDGSGIFKRKYDSILEFKTLIGGEDVDVTEFENSIVISAVIPESFTSIATDNGAVFADHSTNITIAGGEDIIVSAADSIISVDTRLINNKSITNILTTYDFGPISGDFENTVQFNTANSNIEFGTIDIPSNVNLECGLISES